MGPKQALRRVRNGVKNRQFKPVVLSVWMRSSGAVSCDLLVRAPGRLTCRGFRVGERMSVILYLPAHPVADVPLLHDEHRDVLEKCLVGGGPQQPFRGVSRRIHHLRAGVKTQPKVGKTRPKVGKSPLAPPMKALSDRPSWQKRSPYGK
eukprot:1187115-Prorocentrum_minimum.AAC.3